VEAAPRGVELADVAAAPQEIEAVLILERKAVDAFDEIAFRDIFIWPVGLAGPGAIEPGLAADTLLHHRESEIIGLVARRPHDLGRPEFGDILAEIIAHAFPFPDEADLVPFLEVRRAPQLHAAVGLVIAIAVERPDELV